MKTYQSFCEETSKELFDAIGDKDSLLNWHKGWSGAGSSQLPIGANGPYHGANLFRLLLAQAKNGLQSNVWLTFNQIKRQGGQVKKGAKGQRVIFWAQKNSGGKLKETEEMEGRSDGAQKDAPIFKVYPVFNLEQTDLERPLEENKVFQQGEVSFLLGRLGVEVSHFGNKAFYDGLNDVIVLPRPSLFSSKEDYYATLLHELVHWTGNKGRVPRGCFDNYCKDKKAKAQEELVAEIGSVFLSAHFGLKAGLENHASYVQSWKTLLNEKSVMAATNLAARAFKWLVEKP